MSNEHDNPEQFSFDLRRTIILSMYIEEWGLPITRIRTKKENTPFIEAYLFKNSDAGVVRFATVGVSAQKSFNKEIFNHEFLFVLSEDLGGCSENEVFNYLFDICAYALNENVCICPETLILENQLAPRVWKLKAILIDGPRGEREIFENIHIGKQHVSLLWLVPIYSDEYELIQRSGIRAFDMNCEKSDFSLVDINRESVLSEHPRD